MTRPALLSPCFRLVVSATTTRARRPHQVTPASTRSNCFTKHYTAQWHGAGSVLASERFAAQHCVLDARGRLHFASAPPPGVRGLRFFSPREVAALHGLPPDFVAAALGGGAGGGGGGGGGSSHTCTPERLLALLGNGLSADVVAHLLQYLLLPAGAGAGGSGAAATVGAGAGGR